MKTIGIGVLGCGNISDIYLSNLTSFFPYVTVEAVCDLDESKARAQAEKYGIGKVLSLEEMLADESIRIVLNLTTPKSHYPLTKRCLEAGKNVHTEKPLALNYRDAAELCSIAEEKGLLLGCAPDTFFGASWQTAREVIDRGDIGRVISGEAFFLNSGAEDWHPSPAFYYEKGGGPVFDMGPYNLHNLFNLLGPADGLFGMHTKGREERLITSQPLCGTKIPVEVPTHVSGLIHFASGAVISIIESFDAVMTSLPHIELHGTEGSLLLPDPNYFGGDVLLCKKGDTQWKPVSISHPYGSNQRGAGVCDMAKCLLFGGTPRASGRMAAHAVEVMESLHLSWDEKRFVSLQSTFTQPAPLQGEL